MPIEFDNERHCKDFVRLNEQWITEHFSIEDADRKLATNPFQIVHNGGHIISLVEGGEEGAKIGSDTIFHAFSPFHASAMRRGFLRLRGFCAPSPIAQAAAFRPAAVSPAPTFSRCGVSCVLFNPRPTRRSSGPAYQWGRSH